MTFGKKCQPDALRAEEDIRKYTETTIVSRKDNTT